MTTKPDTTKLPPPRGGYTELLALRVSPGQLATLSAIASHGGWTVQAVARRLMQNGLSDLAKGTTAARAAGQPIPTPWQPYDPRPRGQLMSGGQPRGIPL